MYAEDSLISLSLIFLPAILVFITLPSGETKLVIVRLNPFKTVMNLISFKPPTVDPEDPPITISDISITRLEPLMPASTSGGNTFAPVVVIAETTVNIPSIGTMSFVIKIIVLAITIKTIINWN